MLDDCSRARLTLRYIFEVIYFEPIIAAEITWVEVVRNGYRNDVDVFLSNPSFSTVIEIICIFKHALWMTSFLAGLHVIEVVADAAFYRAFTMVLVQFCWYFYDHDGCPSGYFEFSFT